MSDESYLVEKPRPQPKRQFRTFSSPRRQQPVWQTRAELLEVLAKYRNWYAGNLGDQRISRIEKLGLDFQGSDVTPY
jgi:hypothetical protein